MSEFVGDQELTKLLSNHVYWFLRNRLNNDSRLKTKKWGNEELNVWHTRVREEWGKLAERTFSMLRFRKGNDFVNQFQSLFFESGQFESRIVAQRLIRDTDVVKTLTLALLAEQMGRSIEKKSEEVVVE